MKHKDNMISPPRYTLLLLSLFPLSGLLPTMAESAYAATVRVTVIDANQKPLKDAVIYIESANTKKLPPSTALEEIEQRSRKFDPLVTVVQTGTSVAFPNKDSVRHHVYSFSPAKTFELQLYSGVPGKPVLFDKPGTVVMGCNIHDRMVAYVHVVETPYFGKSDDAGNVNIMNLPAGKYSLKAWHYALPAEKPVMEQLLIAGDGNADIKLAMPVNLSSSSR